MVDVALSGPSKGFHRGGTVWAGWLAQRRKQRAVLLDVLLSVDVTSLIRRTHANQSSSAAEQGEHAWSVARVSAVCGPQHPQYLQKSAYAYG